MSTKYIDSLIKFGREINNSKEIDTNCKVMPKDNQHANSGDLCTGIRCRGCIFMKSSAFKTKAINDLEFINGKDKIHRDIDNNS